MRDDSDRELSLHSSCIFQNARDAYIEKYPTACNWEDWATPSCRPKELSLALLQCFYLTYIFAIFRVCGLIYDDDDFYDREWLRKKVRLRWCDEAR